MGVADLDITAVCLRSERLMIAKRSAKSRADAKAAVVSAVANKLKDAEGRLRLIRAILDIARYGQQAASSVSVTLRLADDPLLRVQVLECGDGARTTDSA